MDKYILQYFYTPLREELVGPLYLTWAGHRKCTEKHVIGPRVLDCYKIGFVVSGKGYIEQGSDRRRQLGAGDMFVLFPMARHYYYADPCDPWELLWVCFNGSICSSLLSAVGLSENNFVAANMLTSSIEKTMHNILKGMGDTEDTGNLRATGYLHILFAQVRSTLLHNRGLAIAMEKEDAVEKATAFIEQYYYQHIDVEMLCAHVNYSRSYLSHKFKQELGVTIPEFINKARVHNAKNLLRETSLTIQEVARSVGIVDSFYFSKIFKRLVGTSPNRYRKDIGYTNEPDILPDSKGQL